MQTSSSSGRRIRSLSAVLIAAGALTMAEQAAAGPAASTTPDSTVPPTVDVPLRVLNATLGHDRLAVTLSCARDGRVKTTLSSRRFATSRFDCAGGVATTQLRVPKKLSARVRGSRVRIDARTGSMAVTRTLRPKPAKARLAADITFNINGGINYDPLPCYGYARVRMSATGWVNWFGTTGVCAWHVFAGDDALGTITQYSYLSVGGTWELYRTRECPTGSTTCRWTYARAGF